MIYLFFTLLFGGSAEKRDQTDKKFFFKIMNILDQMIKFTSILLINFFLKKFSVWSLFSALTPSYHIKSIKNFEIIVLKQIISDFKSLMKITIC